MNGFLLIDKEEGLTSFDAVRDLRRLSGEKSIGHAGTLDPLATGLLILALGEGTKLLEFLIGMDKEYEVSAKFGVVSETYDEEGGKRVIMKDCPGIGLSWEKVQRFLGEIDQMPPKYSALKIKGKRAADIMRDGGDVELKPRKVTIYSFVMNDFHWPNGDFVIKCSSGTYVRSLIHDLGQELKCGAYVTRLRRTIIGNYNVADAVKLNELNEKKIPKYLCSLEDFVSDFSRIDLDEEELRALKNGRILLNKKTEQDEFLMAFHKEKLVGVIEPAKDSSGIKFRKMIFSS